ncbi:MAG: tRNA (adenosine(37)-N6)-threonylcarbamoyltransferase complex transferase subunit TsaD [Eubacteriales bacterium]|nr:tRNA (adenosine(37)-N6)-threonylcarbamoyltransferase complex transferase subunit TsaD [Eubacteriales bacterium]
MKGKSFITLGIETSCDETAIAAVADGRKILSNVISTQIPIHTKFGGVVPEIASRRHLENINDVLSEALGQADLTLDDVDLIGVTYGPGLIGAVLIGVATAKALSFAKGIPLVGVNHMHGHVSANYLVYPDLEPPFLALVVSGGHTNLIDVTDYNECTVIGSTRDDACGEAYDKVARVIGLGYPGGPKIDRAAKEGNPRAYEFKRVMLEKGSYDFSFSGIKTQVLNVVNQQRMRGEEVRTEDVCASFQAAVVDVLVEKAMEAVHEFGEKRIVMAGGVSANFGLRKGMEDAAEKAGIRLYKPKPVLCTDNGAMIASAAYYKYRKHGADDLTLDAYADLPY